MSKDEVFNQIADIIAERFEIDRETIKPELNFKTDLDADSIDFVEFILELEDTFNAEISDEDAENLNTVGEAVDYIMSHSKS
ncbi:acyl carrier protein [Secundilactobacillus kimchicus]|uniref:Acyl carrier protein n=1 Tax=Secundilactobacillus kimchicus JCM 15530 TaxID=1302272 RepID=A0A0R1HR20_9LACO|nr:acyl carrier protein [Secundilactobacillus kimchicus]KRK49294.1 hypothetical protein FC96_GL000218 [Secundilactobacillus kimchicus JCM 15530]MBT9672841.1 acyl carrier protein [Secundilactobacillus kimchicus]